MNWRVGRARVLDDMADQQLYRSDTEPEYRIYGFWHVGQGYRYRLEYRLDTGWWPVGTYERVREAKVCAQYHYEHKFLAEVR